MRAGWRWISLPYIRRACRPIAGKRKDPKPKDPGWCLISLHYFGRVRHSRPIAPKEKILSLIFHEKKRKEKDIFLQSEPTEGFALRVYTTKLKSKRKKFVTEAYVTD